MALYDTIGKKYNVTRKADTYITGRLFNLLQPPASGKFADIGCGTGNYLTALSALGLDFLGIDPSETMLEAARTKNSHSTFICAFAENIPLPDESIDGVIGTFTMHHWDDIGKGLSEIYRILKPGRRFVALSFTPQQMTGYWLHHYFPKMIERSMETIPDQKSMEQLFYNAGFASVATEKYFVHEDIEDHFLYSNKYKPQAYLVPGVRDNISSFSVFSDAAEVEKGLSELQHDINSGKITSVIKEFENDMGDYLFYIAVK